MLSSKYEDLLVNNFLKLSLQNKYSNVYSKFNPFVNIVGGGIHHPKNRSDVDRMLTEIDRGSTILSYRRGALDNTGVPKDFYIYLDLGNGIVMDCPKHHFHIFKENGEWVFQLTARCNDEQIDNIPNCNNYMNNIVNPGWDIEIRVDPSDNKAYTEADFIKKYGGTTEWDAAETRIDPSDNKAYTKTEFITHYSGTTEWDTAAPERTFAAPRHKLSGCHFNENIRYAWSHTPNFDYRSEAKPTRSGNDFNFLRSLISGKLANSNFVLDQRASKRYAPRLFRDFDIPSYTNETSYLNALRKKMEEELSFVQTHCTESCDNTDCDGNKILLIKFITYLESEGIDNITKQINIYSRLFSLKNFKLAYDQINVDTYMNEPNSQELVLNLLKKVFITLTNDSTENNLYDTKITIANLNHSYEKYKYIFQYLGFKDTLYAACIAHIRLHFLNERKDAETDETKKKELNQSYQNLKTLIDNYIDPKAKSVEEEAQEYIFNPLRINLNPKFETGQKVDYGEQLCTVVSYDFFTQKYTVRNVVSADAHAGGIIEHQVNESDLEAHIELQDDLPIWKEKILYTKKTFKENYNTLLDFMNTLGLQTDVRSTKFKNADLKFVDEITDDATKHFSLIDILKILLKNDYYKTKYNLHRKINFLESVKIILDLEEMI